MRRAINILAWVSVTIAIMFLLLTLLTTYIFLKGNLLATYFNGYFTFQCAMAVTMLFWSFNLFLLKDNPKNKIYSFFCLLIGLVTIFFITMRVR